MSENNEIEKIATEVQHFQKVGFISQMKAMGKSDDEVRAAFPKYARLTEAVSKKMEGLAVTIAEANRAAS